MWVNTFGFKVCTGEKETGQEIFQLIISEIKKGNLVCCSHPKLTCEEEDFLVGVRDSQFKKSVSEST